MKDFNWENLRFFLAVVRCETPTGAASLLRVDHNTVRRKLAVLEKDFDAKLFSRRGGKYILTEEGELLLKAAEKIEHLTIDAQSQIAGKDFEVSGTVRIAAPDGIATFFLAPWLVGLRKMYPDLNVKLIIPRQQSKLSRREADMALTIDRPSEKKVISEKAGDVMLRLYASKAYLAEAPKIETSKDLALHDFVTGLDDFDFGPTLNNVLAELGSTFKAKIACSSIVSQLKAAAAGCGVCCFADFIAQTEPDLIRILPDELSFSREVWLAVHRDLAQLERVIAVKNYLLQQFEESRSYFG
jgi:DNA-binding transcriptional LysR family regulator